MNWATINPMIAARRNPVNSASQKGSCRLKTMKAAVYPEMAMLAMTRKWRWAIR